MSFTIIFGTLSFPIRDVCFQESRCPGEGANVQSRAAAAAAAAGAALLKSDDDDDDARLRRRRIVSGRDWRVIGSCSSGVRPRTTRAVDLPAVTPWGDTR